MSILVTKLYKILEKLVLLQKILTLNNCRHKHNRKPKVFLIFVANSFFKKWFSLCLHFTYPTLRKFSKIKTLKSVPIVKKAFARKS